MRGSTDRGIGMPHPPPRSHSTFRRRSRRRGTGRGRCPSRRPPAPPIFSLPLYPELTRSPGRSRDRRRRGRSSTPPRNGSVIRRPVLVVVPTNNERDNIDPWFGASWPRDPTWTCGWRTTEAPMARPRPFARWWPSFRDEWGSSCAKKREDEGPRSSRVSGRASRIRRAIECSSRWTPTSPTTRTRSPSSERSSLRPTWSSVPGTSRAEGAPTGGSGGRLSPGWPIATSPSWRASLCATRRVASAPTAEMCSPRPSSIASRSGDTCVHGEMAYQAWVHGFRLGEVPIHFKNRARAASKLSGEEIYTALLNFALLRFRYGFRPRRRNPEE